jgi:hypothetical protein
MIGLAPVSAINVVIAVFGGLLGITIGVVFGIAIQHTVSDKDLDVLKAIAFE